MASADAKLRGRVKGPRPYCVCCYWVRKSGIRGSGKDNRIVRRLMRRKRSREARHDH